MTRYDEIQQEARTNLTLQFKVLRLMQQASIQPLTLGYVRWYKTLVNDNILALGIGNSLRVQFLRMTLTAMMAGFRKAGAIEEYNRIATVRAKLDDSTVEDVNV